MNPKLNIKGRGAQKNTPNRFFELSHEVRDDFLEYCQKEGELVNKTKTQYLNVFPKTIVNKVTSPDVGMSYSMNMYQGCEHGCIYCYARNSHEFWGYSAGLDFERKILVKKDAPKLLDTHLKKKSWKAEPIVMSGNTDCYQPAEKQFKITRQCLKVFLKYKHPVAIITKNALILRDLKKRLLVVKELSENGIPVNVMLAPIIPSINSHEILPMAKAVSEAGALSIAHTIVRLNGAIGEIFTDWIKKTLPDRADKVLHQIESCHGGTLNESRYGVRMRGEGQIAQQINDLVLLARLKYFKNKIMPTLNRSLYEPNKNGQLKLF